MQHYDNMFRELGAGGFTRIDGSIEFYARINALLRPDMVVVDLGAGRGRSAEDDVAFRRSLAIIKGKVAKVIGVDVDDAVMENPIVDEAIVFDGTTIPLLDRSVDLILSDWTFEHIADPRATEAEAFRILKPGGWLCARTPHSLSMVALASRMVPNRLHAAVISKVQPGAKAAHDIFPTFYRLNTIAAVKRIFRALRWKNHSYTYSSEPTYHFCRSFIVRLMLVLQYIKGIVAGENLLVFLQKKGGA